MSAEILDTCLIWRNPVLQRFRRSRLRLRKSIFWCLLTIIVATFVVSLVYVIQSNSGIAPQAAARRLWIPLLIIQGLIVLIKGTGSVSAGLIQDKIDQTLDYQRLTPISPSRNLIGYLFGLPVLEYVMFALTLPHLIFVVIVGNVPIATLASVYTVFFSCALLYHLTGIAAGLVMRKWIWGYLLSIFLVATINVVLPTFIGQFGLKFFQYLSIWPVISQNILPLLAVPGFPVGAISQNPYLSLADSVPFFAWELSAFSFTLILQGALIGTFSTMAWRRWRCATRHSLSKPYALSFLCAFVFLFMGNLWPAITGQYLPFPIFGETEISQVSETIAVGLPLVYSLMTWLLCLILFAIVLPSHDSYTRGIRRASKHGRPHTRASEDDSDSPGFMSLFVAVALLGFIVLTANLRAAGLADFWMSSASGAWYLPVAFALVLVYSAILVQAIELRPATLAILIVWFVPVLTAIVLSAAVSDFGRAQAVIASTSPLALVVMSGLLAFELAEPGLAEGIHSSVLTGIWTGLIFLTMQTVWLSLRWRRRRRAIAAAAL